MSAPKKYEDLQPTKAGRYKCVATISQWFTPGHIYTLHDRPKGGYAVAMRGEDGASAYWVPAHLGKWVPALSVPTSGEKVA
jgi:hypothetical protein